LHPCYYGIDLPNAEDLLAAQLNNDVEKIRQAINADSLSYLSETAVRRILAPMGQLCMACASGKYEGGNPEEVAKSQGVRDKDTKSERTLTFRQSLAPAGAQDLVSHKVDNPRDLQPHRVDAEPGMDHPHSSTSNF